MVYKVELEIDVDVIDDFPFEKNCDLIKDDIEMEINCCWHSVEITKMRFSDPTDSHHYGFIKIPDGENAQWIQKT